MLDDRYWMLDAGCAVIGADRSRQDAAPTIRKSSIQDRVSRINQYQALDKHRRIF